MGVQTNDSDIDTASPRPKTRGLRVLRGRSPLNSIEFELRHTHLAVHYLICCGVDYSAALTVNQIAECNVVGKRYKHTAGVMSAYFV